MKPSPTPPPSGRGTTVVRLAALLPLLLGTAGCPGLFPQGDGTTGDDGSSDGTTVGQPSTISATSWVSTESTQTSGDSDSATDSGTTWGVGTTVLTSGSGDDATSDGSGTSTSTTGDPTDGGESSSGSTGGAPDPPGGGCEMDCNPGCEEVVVAALQGETTLWHAGTSRMALDEAGRVVLWSAPADDIVAVIDGVDAADLAVDVAAVEIGGSVSLRSTFDASELGTVDVTGATWGLARDGSYLWVADLLSLRVFELDGTLRWDRPGDYTSAHVLPLAASLHVQASGTGATVEAIDAASGMASTTPFAGTFDGWFHDQPRFWTVQGDAYRLYDVDGSLLALATGTPVHGYGDWLVLGSFSVSIVAVTDVATPVHTILDVAISGPALLGDVVGGNGELVRLDQGAIMPQVVPVSCCAVFGPQSFAFDDGQWIIGDAEGQVGDDQGDVLTSGQIEFVHGSIAGTFGLTFSNADTTLFEVSPTCVLSELSTIPRDYPYTGRISGDGSTFLAVARHPQISIDLHDTATGAAFDTTVYGLSTSVHQGIGVSDAADLVALRSINTGVSNSLVLEYPGWAQWFGGMWSQTPAISPNGLLAVRNDAVGGGLNATFEGSLSYVYDAAGLQWIFDGVTHGFVDDTTLLVAHYTFVPAPGGCWQPGECDVLVEVELVDPMGMPIGISPIPDPAGFERVSSTEVFLPDPPTIVDVYTGAVQWSGPPGPATAVGPDHVAQVVGNDLVLTKWR